MNQLAKAPLAESVAMEIQASLPREDTAMHWETAATFKIALITRENIVNLLENLDASILPDQIYNATLALIPSKKVDQQG
jgi:hypothetical protein